MVHLDESDLAQRAFCSGLFPGSTLSSSCLLFPASQSPFPEKMSARGHAFHFSVFLSPLLHNFLCFDSMFLWPQPPLSTLSPASAHQPCLSCSRFSFCWRVLIGLKWVTCPITQSFKPSLNVSVSWGSGGGGALCFCPPPLAALLIGGETPGLMGLQRFGPQENP